jgi:hypothetical protein
MNCISILPLAARFVNARGASSGRAIGRRRCGLSNGNRCGAYASRVLKRA